MRPMLYCLVFLFSFVSLAVAAHASQKPSAQPPVPSTIQITAREVFTLLPSSIFDTTAEGLPDEEKERLLEYGESSFWELAGETEDVIAFRALPFRDSFVALRLFRNQSRGSVVAAIGTLGTPICSLELWQMDASRRIVPYDTPDDVCIDEFFAKGQRLPKDVTASVLPCLGMGDLKAQAVFWNATGMTEVPLSREIGWHWTGSSFEKFIRIKSYPLTSEQAQEDALP